MAYANRGLPYTQKLQRFIVYISNKGHILKDRKGVPGVPLRAVIVFAPLWEHAYYYMQNYTHEVWRAPKTPKKRLVYCTHPAGVTLRGVQGAEPIEVMVRNTLGLKLLKVA